MTKRVFVGLLVSLALWVSGAVPWAYAGSERPAAAAQDGTININTASKAELMSLRGVGKVVAERIIEYREKNGPFTKPEEIQRVKGIGTRIWEVNRKAIRVE